MRPFSQRQGIIPIKDAIQKDRMDDSLRNKLWNMLDLYLWEPYTESHMPSRVGHMGTFLLRLWTHYFEKPIDTIHIDWANVRSVIREYFFRCPWNQVYDFTEFVAQSFPDERSVDKFVTACNSILEQELSAYRFVGRQITPITSQQEIEAVEQAIQNNPLSAVSTHLQRALELFSDREDPDYRNSIKESISAVEALCRVIAGDPKATLGQALKTIEDTNQVELHGALRQSVTSLYGYTSDTGGIRHAMLEKSDLTSEDAKFMLVACSAFINYLTEKATKAGLKLLPPG